MKKIWEIIGAAGAALWLMVNYIQWAYIFIWQKKEKVKQAWKQYLFARSQKCVFPHGHDWAREIPYKYMRGTGKFIKDEEIMEEVDNWWYRCKRCGKKQYFL